MVEKIFGAVTRFGKRRKFQNNFILKRLIPLYHKVQRLTASRVDAASGENTLGDALRNDFFVKNPDRVSAVAEMLADDKSRRTYLGMVKFRQTGLKKDFPFECYDKKQYFIEELTLGRDEVFVDCGAFTGDTIDDFLKLCPEFRQIAAFEPDSENFKKLQKKHGDNAKITLINAGAYDREGSILFDAQGNGYSRLVGDSGPNPVPDASAAAIQVKSIDSLNLKNVSLVKMDIEGAEMSALAGAKKTILRDKPKLAICIYHSNEDMVRVAEYIHGLVPEYRLYVRQHFLFPGAAETVLYAVI